MDFILGSASVVFGGMSAERLTVTKGNDIMYLTVFNVDEMVLRVKQCDELKIEELKLLPFYDADCNVCNDGIDVAEGYIHLLLTIVKKAMGAKKV
jgi:hypothetical protein